MSRSDYSKKKEKIVFFFFAQHGFDSYIYASSKKIIWNWNKKNPKTNYSALHPVIVSTTDLMGPSPSPSPSLSLYIQLTKWSFKFSYLNPLIPSHLFISDFHKLQSNFHGFLMETSEILLSSFLLFFFFFLLRPAGACRRSCSSDGKVDVRFPFNIVNGSSSTTTDRCGFGPGFGLTCKNNQPVLNLPMAGDFIVDLINYETQRIWIKDPEDCIPKRLLNFTLSESPFQTLRGTKRRFRLMSCNMNNFTIPPAPYVYHFWSESCVSETNHAIVAVDATNREIHEDCHEIKNVSFSLPRWTYLGEWFLELIWDNPDCKSCEVSGGTCGYKGRTGSDVRCFKPSSHGESSSSSSSSFIYIYNLN